MEQIARFGPKTAFLGQMAEWRPYSPTPNLSLKGLPFQTHQRLLLSDISRYNPQADCYLKSIAFD